MQHCHDLTLCLLQTSEKSVGVPGQSILATQGHRAYPPITGGPRTPAQHSQRAGMAAVSSSHSLRINVCIRLRVGVMPRYTQARSSRSHTQARSSTSAFALSILNWPIDLCHLEMTLSCLRAANSIKVNFYQHDMHGAGPQVDMLLCCKAQLDCRHTNYCHGQYNAGHAASKALGC